MEKGEALAQRKRTISGLRRGRTHELRKGRTTNRECSVRLGNSRKSEWS